MLRAFTHSTGRGPTFLRFAGVGSTMALIDAVGLYALHAGVGINVYGARVVSFLVAMTAGYFLNRHFTFRFRPRLVGLGTELTRFYAVHASGGLINYGTFVGVLFAGRIAGVDGAAAYWLPLLGVWLGGVAGMCFNFVFASKLVFRTQ